MTLVEVERKGRRISALSYLLLPHLYLNLLLVM